MDSKTKNQAIEINGKQSDVKMLLEHQLARCRSSCFVNCELSKSMRYADGVFLYRSKNK